MAAYWDPDWDDDEKLKRQSATTLYHIYNNAIANGKDADKIRAIIIAKSYETLELAAGDNQLEVNPYDLLAFVKVAKDEDLQVQRSDGLVRDFKDTIIQKINTQEQTLSDKDDLISRLKRKALLESAKIIYKDDKDAVDTLNQDIQHSAENISQQLNTAQEITDEEFNHFDQADKVGALDDIDQDVKEAFLDRLAELSGWEDVNANQVLKNDYRLDSVIKSLDVYDENGNLTPLYESCQELAEKVQFELPEGSDPTSPEMQKLRMSYVEQLLANSAQRATNNFLKNKGLLYQYEDKAALMSAYKQEIYHNFERSVVTAGLATSRDAGVLLENIEYNELTKTWSYEEAGVDASKSIEDVLDGNLAINPYAVAADNRQLNIETKKIERILGRKKLDPNKLPFFTKAKSVVKASYNNIVKQGGWKKIALNAAMFGGAVMATASGVSAVVLTGAAVYAGWTAVNAWIMPIYDRINADMRQKGIKDSQERKAYIKSNWKKAKQETYAEGGFKRRAWIRTTEGLAIGGIMGAFGVGAGAGLWSKTLLRQGASLAGKATTAALSWFGLKKAKKELYSAKHEQQLQIAEMNLKRDKVTLAAVVAGAAIGDTIKLVNELGVSSDESIIDYNTVDTANVASKVDTANVASKVDTANVASKVDGVSAEDAAKNAEYDFDSSKLSQNEYKMYINSISKWDNNALANRIAEIEKEGGFVNAEMKKALEESLSNRAYGKSVIQGFYDTIKSGKVETIPEGMSAVEYVDKLTRLAQLAPIEHKKAIEIMTKDLLCEDYVASEAEIKLAHNALNTIIYEKGSMECVVPDSKGNLCIIKTPRFGQYVGNQQMASVQMPDGTTKELPLRTMNKTTGLSMEVNCEEGSGKITSVYTKHILKDCGCEETTPRDNLEPIPENPKLSDPTPAFPKIPEIEPKFPQIGEEIEINFKSPLDIGAKATAVYSDPNSDYNVESKVPDNAEFIRIDRKGNAHFWQKGAMLEGSDIVSQSGGVEVIYPVALHIDNLDNLGTPKITNTEDTLSFQYGQGRNAIKVEIDQESGKASFFVGKREYVLDQESAISMSQKMEHDLVSNKDLNAKYRLLATDEIENNNDHLHIDDNDKFNQQKENQRFLHLLIAYSIY